MPGFQQVAARRFGTLLYCAAAAVLACAAGAVLVASTVVAMGAFGRDSFAESITSLSPHDVRWLDLDREYKNLAVNQDINLVQSHLVVTNRAEIALFCQALHNAKRFYPNHPGDLWCVNATVHLESRSLDFRISKTSNQGVLIDADRTYRCDALAPILEEIAKANDFGVLSPDEADERLRLSQRDDMILLGSLLTVLAVCYVIPVQLLLVIPVWRLCRRTGLHPMLSILMLLPVFNVGLLCFIAFRRWPPEIA